MAYHGDMRRPNSCHSPLRNQRFAARRDHFDTRPRLSGMRYPGIDRGTSVTNRKSAERYFYFVRRYVACPGKSGDLLSLKSRGADVRMLYSPLDALKIASASPEKEVVFLAVGFETTAPVHALTVMEAHRKISETSPYSRPFLPFRQP